MPFLGREVSGITSDQLTASNDCGRDQNGIRQLDPTGLPFNNGLLSDVVRDGHFIKPAQQIPNVPLAFERDAGQDLHPRNHTNLFDFMAFYLISSRFDSTEEVD